MHNKKSIEFNEVVSPELLYNFLFLWAVMAQNIVA